MRGKFLRLIPGGDAGVRMSTILLLLILLLVGLQSALLAALLPFWFDEANTVLLCHLPSMHVILQALHHAADTQPPAFDVVERAARFLIADDHLGFRLPSILGLLLTIACIYFALLRRVSRWAALAGATFVLATALPKFAVEARPYALMVGCVAGAILAWQRLDESRVYPALLAAALAAAVSVHYYAIFVWTVFLAAEATVCICRRQFRAWAWASILLGCLPIALCVPFLLELRQYFGLHYWGRPTLKLALESHDSLFNISGHWGWTIAVGLTVALLCPRHGKSEAAGLASARKAAAIPVEERALALMLLWLPLIVFVAAKVGHGALEEGFLLPSILGGAFAVGYAIDRAPAAGGALLVLLFVTQYAASLPGLMVGALHGTLLDARRAASGEIAAIAGQTHEPDLPIVVANDLDYLPRFYYTPVGARSQLFAIADPAAAVAFSDRASDTSDLALLALKQFVPLQTEDYAGFVSAHPKFLLVESEEPELEWLPARLLKDGDTITLAGVSPVSDRAVLKVTVKP